MNKIESQKDIENNDSIKKVLTFCNNFFYSLLFPLFFLLLLFFIEYSFKINLIYMFLLFFIGILCWIAKLMYIPKNKSKKYGIIFLINNGMLYNESFDLFFKKIKFIMQDNFTICVFNNNFLRNNNTSEKIEKVMRRKNYQMVINSFALFAKENSENICSIDNDNITLLLPSNNKDILNRLEFELSRGFKKYINLREKNNYIDITENSEILSASIRYLVSIIYIMFNKLDQSVTELQTINFNNLPPKNQTVKYIKREVENRYSDICIIKILRIIKDGKYLYDESILNELIILQEELQTHINRSPNYYNAVYNNYDILSKIMYAKKDYEKSYELLKTMRKKEPTDYVVVLSMAFIKINLKQIEKGVDLYKKVSKRENVDINVINECLGFIDAALKNKSYDTTLLKLSKGLLLYYWIDKSEGRNLILEIYNDLNSISSTCKEYIEVRYLK